MQRDDEFIDRGFLRRSTPPAGEMVQVLCRRGGKIETLPSPCIWTAEGGWMVVATGEKVTGEIVGWRRR